jgi:hypothetical protein
VSALFAKLGMERRTQAVAYAVRAFGDQHDQRDPGYGEGHSDLATKDLVPCSKVTATRQPRGMYSDDSVLGQLSTDVCLQLMASVSVGRIIYTRRALPAVELVNFALDHGDIVIRTDSGGKLAAATQHSVVAFEVDCLDTAQHAGWSVTAVGQSREVTDTGDIDRLRKIGLSSWAPGARDHFIRISPEILNGRRLLASVQEELPSPLMVYREG